MDKSIETLSDGVITADRMQVARAITLVESDLPSDVEKTKELMSSLKSTIGKAIKVGVSGAPGVGKSTFIETLGMQLLQKGHRVAVIAVDPSSPLSGGSLLGDKTRMPRLSKDPRAFIRASPSRGMLGGLAPGTSDVIKVLEAAGYDIIIVETVGVGQSEIAVAPLVDTFLVLIAPASGDEVQGAKKGILELAHIVAVTKCDGDLKAAAERTRHEYLHAFSNGRKRPGKWIVPVLLISSVNGDGIDELWQKVVEHQELSRK